MHFSDDENENWSGMTEIDAWPEWQLIFIWELQCEMGRTEYSTLNIYNNVPALFCELKALSASAQESNTESKPQKKQSGETASLG